MEQTTQIPIRQYWNLLVNYLKPEWFAACMLALLLFGGIALQLISPQILRAFIDATQTGVEQEKLLRIAVGFIIIALLIQVISVLSRYVSENIAWKTTNALRGDLADHCLRLDLSFHNTRTPGEMIERLDGDVTTLSNFFSQFVIMLIGNGLLLIGILVMLFLTDWRVGLVMTLFAFIVIYVLGRFRDIAVPHWAAERQASADLYGFLEERLAGVEDIRSSGAEAYILLQFYGLMRNMLQKYLKAGMMFNILFNTMFFLFSVGMAASFTVGVYLFLQDAITIGTVYMIFYYTTMLERPINSLSHEIGDLQRAGAGIGRIKELFGIQSKLVIGASRDIELPRSQGGLAVEFNHVTFSYADSPTTNTLNEVGSKLEKQTVLQDVSFYLRPGSVLGLLGRTGSGKTTLTRLLFRFYDPDQGTVRIASNQSPHQLVDIRWLPGSYLRSQIGMVTQNVHLFNASVRHNLTFFDPSIADEKILSVIADTGLGDWFKRLPAGLDTILDSGGTGLSAGEGQLLAFLRIFLKDPQLVVLDEASARLDPATEALIERAIERLIAGRTAIIIAHRLGTVQRASEIMILENGKIEEYGERQHLAQDPSSTFYRLLQTGLEEVLT